MLLKTITDSNYSPSLMQWILEDPASFKMIMSISFAVRIGLFIVSMAFISYLFITKPDNLLWYIVPVIFFVYNLKNLFEYREYFGVFIESCTISYEILYKISSMSDEETQVFLEGFGEARKQEFLEQKRNVQFYYEKN
jgi:hypothetical protein